MTSRMRWVPASGANVRPPFLRPATKAAISTPNESRRWDGTEMRTPSPSVARFRRSRISPIWEWSVEESDVRLTSSYPVSLSPVRTDSTMLSAVRSLTGLYIMPAWQNRQPRAQPRRTSTFKRS